MFLKRMLYLPLSLRRNFGDKTSFKLNNSSKVKPSKNSVITVQPQDPIRIEDLPPRVVIDQETIAQLEKVSLLKFQSETDFDLVEEYIRTADEITLANTDGIEPMYTLLEDSSLRLRPDGVTEVDCKEAILRNSKILEEDYFVAPPGNIPLETEDYGNRSLDSSKKNTK